MTSQQLDLNDTVTKKLAAFIETFGERKVEQEIVQQVKRALIDYYCAALTGSQSEVSKLVLNYLVENEGVGECKIIGTENRFSKTNAAFMNGTSAHSLDFDDGHTQGGFHPGTVVIPAVLAVSQSLKSTPKKIIDAIVIGYEICIRISSTMHPASRQRGFHNTPVAGIFGATAAVSYLYGLNDKQIQHAFGIAGSFCGGIFAFLGTGSEVKRIHPGQAARDGIMAAELARSGLTGPGPVLEGENGIFQAFAGNQVNEDRIFQGLGSRYQIMDIYFKPYPCCRHLHSAIDVIQEMKQRDSISVEKIEKIRVGVNRIAFLHKHKECNNLLDAQMSLPYAISIAILNERLHVELFEPKKADDRVWKLCDRIEVYVDDEADRLYPSKRGSRVDIIMTDGQCYSHAVDNPLGEPSKPLSDAQLRLKFLDNCSPIMGEEKAHQFLVSMDHFEEDASFLYQV